MTTSESFMQAVRSTRLVWREMASSKLEEVDALKPLDRGKGKLKERSLLISPTGKMDENNF